MKIRPVLEVIQTPLERTFRVYAHDYPFAYSGWHHHPEYELHLIRRSRGHFYVGTYAGAFGPGNLVMTGPNLPHMWVSDSDDRDAQGCIGGRDLVLQLSAGFAERCVAAFSDCSGLIGLIEASRAGIEFSPAASAEAARLMEALLAASGLERVALFFTLLRFWTKTANGSRCRSRGRTTNAPNPSGSNESSPTSLQTSTVRTCRAGRSPTLKGWAFQPSQGCSSGTSGAPAANTSII